MSRPLLPATALAILLLAGCADDKHVVKTYTRAGAEAEATRRSDDAEAYHRSAVERARASLGRQDQSDALFRLGTFYRKQARFQESIPPLIESVSLALEADTVDELALGRRYAELSRSYAALNRWQDGAAMMRNVVPLQPRYPADEAAEIAELASVYRTRLTELGLDAAFLR